LYEDFANYLLGLFAKLP